MRSGSRFALILACALVGQRAHADEGADKLACIDDHRMAQVLKIEGRLHASRQRLLLCGQTSCPSVVRADCLRWLDELEVEQPTMVVAASRAGVDVDAVRVSVDGVRIANALDARALPVDPGEHTLRFEYAGETVVEKVIIRRGEKARVIRVEFARPQRGPDRESTTHISTRAPSAWTWILGGVALAGVSGFATFGLVGRTHEADLADHCAPNCSSDDVGTLNRQYLLADGALTIGIVAAVAAVWVGIATSRRPMPARNVAIMRW